MFLLNNVSIKEEWREERNDRKIYQEPKKRLATTVSFMNIKFPQTFLRISMSVNNSEKNETTRIRIVEYTKQGRKKWVDTRVTVFN